MRLVILTQYYPPETGAPQNRLGDLARRLAERGHEVSVVTAMPNYPTGAVFPEWKGRLLSSERAQSALVLRSWIYTTRREGTVRQLAGYLSFAASSALTAPFRVSRADVILWESPPLFLAPVARILSRRLGAQLVMNVSDLWPESAIALGVIRGRRLAAALERFEAWAYRSADLVTYQTEGIGRGIESRVPGTPGILFPNGVDTAAIRPVDPRPGLRSQLGIPEGVSTVGYVGNFGRAQALEQVAAAAALLGDVPVVLMGDGPRRDKVAACAPPNVRILPPRPHAEIPEVLSLFSVAVVPLAAAQLFDGARPSKMFELLAAGVPFVYCGRGEGARIAEGSGGAVVVEPEDARALACAIRGLLSLAPDERAEMGRKARAYAVAHYDRGRIAQSLEATLQELAHTRSRTTASAAVPSP